MGARKSATMAGLYLGESLEAMRTDKGLLVSEVAAYLGKHKDTVRLWERGLSVPDRSNIESLCKLYDVNGAKMARLTSLASESKTEGLHEGVNVPADLRVLVTAERTAVRIRWLELLVIPGILQTPEYLRALQGASMPLSDDDVKAVRRLRDTRRAAVFERDPLPRLDIVIGCTALDYVSHLPDVRAGQIELLRETNMLPSVDIRMVDRLHPGMWGSFTIIDPRGRRPFCYTESVDGIRYLEARRVLEQFDATFAAVWGASMTLEEYLNE